MHLVLGDLLGVGGMGRVYAAETTDHKRVAVKVLNEQLATDPAMAVRLGEEARAAQRVSHRNVVHVLDHGTNEEGPFLVMERVAGTPLGEILQHEGALPMPRIRTIALQILAGLAAIHRAGLVHGDMKSDNVLVDTSNCLDRVTIIDFGLARPSSSNVALFGAQVVSGTPDYIAPELVRGEPNSPATDLYAVGVVLYEMLTGTTPFGGGTPMEVLERQLHDDIVPPSLRRPDRTIPPPLERAIMRAVDKRAQARPYDAELFATEIARSLPAGWSDQMRPRKLRPKSRTARTRDFSLPAVPRPRHRPRRRLAAGTAPHDSPVVRQRRAELHAALATRAPDPIVAAYLGLVHELVEERRLAAAAHELETATAWLRGEESAPASAWRLLLTLAALYDGLGDPERAAATARDARDAATLASSRLGATRANALLHRLEALARHRRST